MGLNYPHLKEVEQREDRRKQDSYLTEYRKIQEDIRLELELAHKRISRGLAASGFVIGYALLAPQGLVLISLVPIFISMLYILSAQSGIEIHYRRYRAFKLEEKADYIGFEHFYHDFTTDQNWNYLPLFSTYFIGAIFYFGLVLLSLKISSGTYISVAGSNIHVLPVLAVGYFLTSILSIMATIAWFRVRIELGLRTYRIFS